MSDFCVCNQRIEREPYFGMLPVELEEIVFFDPTHDQCLAEWGLTRYPDDPLGVRHCGVDVDEDRVIVRLSYYLGGGSPQAA